MNTTPLAPPPASQTAAAPTITTAPGQEQTSGSQGPTPTWFKSKRSPTTYIITGLAGAGLIIFGILVARIFSSYPGSTENRSKASTGSGTATVSISPATKTLNPGENTTVSLSFDTGGNTISGIAVRLQYNAASPTSALMLTASNLSPVITQTDSSWVCPVKSIQPNGTSVTIDLACLYQNTTGYAVGTTTALATFVLTANQGPSANPVIISFDPTATVITQKSDGKDVAAIPQGSVRITIGGTAPTNSPTPVNPPTATNTPTNTPTPTTASNQPTSTPTPTSTVTPTPGSSFSSSSTEGQKLCNQTCTTNRDCVDELSCAGGICRATRCPSDRTCGCQSRASTASGLLNSGSVSTTMVLAGLGFLLTLGGASLLLSRGLLHNYD